MNAQVLVHPRNAKHEDRRKHESTVGQHISRANVMKEKRKDSKEPSLSKYSDMASDSEGELDYDRLNAACNRKKKKAGGWQAMGFDSNVEKGILKKGYNAPTPIQRKAIPLILDGKDVVAMARTGSGKTAAFLLPLLQRLKRRSAVAGARALLISPTRELALQTFTFTKALAKFTGLRAAVLVGGDSLEDQFGQLHESPDILIATPGRLLHVVVEMNLKLSQIQYVVFDEADRLFELGFAEQLTDVLARLPDDRQTLLFSATLPKQLVQFARAGLSQPVLVRLDVDNKVSDLLTMTFLSCRHEDKVSILLNLLRSSVSLETEQVLIFAATKHHVEWLGDVINRSGFNAACLYSSMDPVARNQSVARFRRGDVSVLVVTDIAARGVDIPLLDVVINFHFPGKAKLFVHRVGRVARAGRSGRALSLVTVDELPYLLDLYLFLGKGLRLAPAADAGEDADRTLHDVFGAVPQAVVDMETDAVRAVHDAMEVSDAAGVAERALKQYKRSRPGASLESVKRAKNDAGLRAVLATPETYPHPLFRNLIGSNEAARLEFFFAGGIGCCWGSRACPEAVQAESAGCEPGECEEGQERCGTPRCPCHPGNLSPSALPKPSRIQRGC